MEKLKGRFYGTSKTELLIDDLTIISSEYKNFHSCPWHYHENAHFAFTTGGTLIETHKKEALELSRGCLLFNNSQDPHFNSNYSELVSAIHIDIPERWLNHYNIDTKTLQGIFKLKDQVLLSIFNCIHAEIRNYDAFSTIALQGFIFQAFAQLLRQVKIDKPARPQWTNKINEILQSRFSENVSLTEIAVELAIHPVYLSQQFPFYFHCSFGTYIRKLRINKAIGLLSNLNLSLTQIAFECGFFDQSHFAKCFQRFTGYTPGQYRRIVVSK
jgi:AraC family transcriptional regulator